MLRRLGSLGIDAMAPVGTEYPPGFPGTYPRIASVVSYQEMPRPPAPCGLTAAGAADGIGGSEAHQTAPARLQTPGWPGHLAIAAETKRR